MTTNTQEFETTDIPLKKLLAWNENVRTTSADQGIDELAHPSPRWDCFTRWLSRKRHEGSSRSLPARDDWQPCPNSSRPVLCHRSLRCRAA